MSEWVMWLAFLFGMSFEVSRCVHMGVRSVIVKVGIGCVVY